MGLFDFLKEKFNDKQSAYITSSKDSTLFLIAKGGLDELKLNYKDLTDKGKFEVLLFNSLIALQAYQEKEYSDYEKTKKDFFLHLYNQAKTYGITYSHEALVEFINNRFKFYSDEIDQMYNNKGYIAGKLYNVFYNTPLVQNPEPNFDLHEVLHFYTALTKMFRRVHDNTVTKL